VPIGGATLTIRRTFIRNQQAAYASDQRGFFFITVSVGRYELLVSKEGYETYMQVKFTGQSSEFLFELCLFQSVEIHSKDATLDVAVFLVPLQPNGWPTVILVTVAAVVLLGLGFCGYSYWRASQSSTGKYLKLGFKPLRASSKHNKVLAGLQTVSHGKASVFLHRVSEAATN